MSDSDRLDRAAALLAEAGLEGKVTVAGHDADVLAVAVPPSCRARLETLAPRLKEAGFRYVTLELDGPRNDGGDA